MVRKSEFLSERTFGINADKAASDFRESFREELKKGKEIHVFIGPR